MLTEKQIQENKQEFIELISSIDREGFDKEGLLAYLENTDFYVAPASTQYQYSYKGGLCMQSLNTYHILEKIISDVAFGDYREDTLKIVGLLYDISKINFYEEYVQNKKVYSSSGSKHDEIGNFDWVSTKAYKVKEAKDRFTVGSKGFNSYFAISSFIPLSNEESISIINHYAGVDKSENTEDICAILKTNNLAVYLHSAAMISCYCVEHK